jgi:hypothetical protein
MRILRAGVSAGSAPAGFLQQLQLAWWPKCCGVRSNPNLEWHMNFFTHPLFRLSAVCAFVSLTAGCTAPIESSPTTETNLTDYGPLAIDLRCDNGSLQFDGTQVEVWISSLPPVVDSAVSRTNIRMNIRGFVARQPRRLAGGGYTFYLGDHNGPPTAAWSGGGVLVRNEADDDYVDSEARPRLVVPIYKFTLNGTTVSWGVGDNDPTRGNAEIGSCRRR